MLDLSLLSTVPFPVPFPSDDRGVVPQLPLLTRLWDAPNPETALCVEITLTRVGTWYKGVMTLTGGLFSQIMLRREATARRLFVPLWVHLPFRAFRDIGSRSEIGTESQPPLPILGVPRNRSFRSYTRFQDCRTPHVVQSSSTCGGFGFDASPTDASFPPDTYPWCLGFAIFFLGGNAPWARLLGTRVYCKFTRDARVDLLENAKMVFHIFVLLVLFRSFFPNKARGLVRHGDGAPVRFE